MVWVGLSTKENLKDVAILINFFFIVVTKCLANATQMFILPRSLRVASIISGEIVAADHICIYNHKAKMYESSVYFLLA